MLKILAATFFLLFVTSQTGAQRRQECRDASNVCQLHVTVWATFQLTRTQACGMSYARRFCKKTCDFCNGYRECEKSRYGCCWDRISPRGPNGECPICRNVYRTFCPRYRPICDRHKSKSRFALGAKFRRMCPVTCNMCVAGSRFYHKRFLASNRRHREKSAAQKSR